MAKTIEGNLIGTGLKIGIVATRWNDFMGKQMLAGAKDALIRHDVADDDITVAMVPGVVCLGVLIRGGTIHFDLIASEATKGINSAATLTGVPCSFGVITTETIEQAIERSGSKAGNKGEEAALAAIEMANLLKQL